MSENKYTSAQQSVINLRGQDMLVSASAGTGKTTVMIERIAQLLSEGADISQIVVVTFTNLAAAEMKNRLASKLAQKRNDKHIVDQLERIETASICTLHSFCSEILRNYFYVVDIDPSYTVLDTNVVNNLRKSAMDKVFLQYFAENDDVFNRAYKIFCKSRQQSNFYGLLFQLYDFSRCIPNFYDWYQSKRKNLINLDGNDNPIITTLLNNIKQNVKYFTEAVSALKVRAQNFGWVFAEAFAQDEEMLNAIRTDNLEHALGDLFSFKMVSLPARNKNRSFSVFDLTDKEAEEQIRYDYEQITEEFGKFAKKYNELSRGQSYAELQRQTRQTVVYLDKLAEIITRFDKEYYSLKKERGGVDFNDLEHLTLKILMDNEAFDSVRGKYKLIFVDEYQDTNPVQEEIISKLASGGNLFMVGDVKQSIYGFRGCEPSIFVDKCAKFKENGSGYVVELNDNFRSNGEVLDFVNAVFGLIMTDGFGKVDYKGTARLNGVNPPVLSVPSARIDFVLPSPKIKKEIDSIYDITEDAESNSFNRQGAMIVKRIRQYVGKTYTLKNGETRRIQYGDIVILFRTLQKKALAIYNDLISANIPVVAGFNVDGYATKEIKDLINLLRVLDNPYNDVYLVGVCLSCLGGFCESELGEIRLSTGGRMPFYDRLKKYVQNGGDSALTAKVNKLFDLLEELRFYSRSASVSEVVLKTMELTQYQLYVQGLPNSGLRLRKLYNFADSVKDAPYAQSIDKFLSYVDEAENNELDTGTGNSNAVRMMTMHASKGLEFPVVIIADLEHGFHKETDSVNCNFDMGLAMKYYDFDTMTYSPTLATAAYGMCNVTKQREEEMRLLYVAMTRAKYALNLVACATEEQINGFAKLPQNANSHLDWILAAINYNAGQIAKELGDKLSVKIYGENLEFEYGSKEPTVQICPQEKDEKAVTDRINYEYPYAKQRDMPCKVVSSALDKAYIGLHEHLEPALAQDGERNYVGTAYHKVYQYADYSADRAEICKTIASLVADGQIEQSIADKLDVDLIFATLHNPDLVKLLYQGKVYHEMPFMLYAPYNQVSPNGQFTDEVILQGVIDLLVIRGDKAAVIDFKYTSHSDRIRQNYSAQLNSYKLAVNKICGIDDVDCYVLSIADNKLIKM